MTQYKHYWLQIRLITDMVRGYYVNVGVMIYETGTGNLVSSLAPWAPTEAFSTDEQVKKAVFEANKTFWESVEKFQETGFASTNTPEDGLMALMKEVRNRADSRIQFSAFRGFHLSEPLEDQLRAIYVAQVQ